MFKLNVVIILLGVLLIRSSVHSQNHYKQSLFKYIGLLKKNKELKNGDTLIVNDGDYLGNTFSGSLVNGVNIRLVSTENIKTILETNTTVDIHKVFPVDVDNNKISVRIIRYVWSKAESEYIIGFKNGVKYQFKFDCSKNCFFFSGYENFWL